MRRMLKVTSRQVQNHNLLIRLTRHEASWWLMIRAQHYIV
jgi:hypothetical protein